MVNVLVIGATGYIGEALALELRRRGHSVYGLVRNAEKAKELIKGEVNVVVGDGTKSETLTEVVKKVDVVINATADFTNPHTDRLSVDAISAAIEKAGGNKKKFIFVSGFLVCEPSDSPLTETSPTLAEEFIKQFSSMNPLFGTILGSRIEVEKKVITSKIFSGTVVRPPMIYGGAKPHFSVHFKNADEGKVVVYGDENALISFSHVDDVVDGLIKIVEAEISKVEHQIFMCGETKRTTQKELAYALARGAGKDIKQLKEETAPVPFPLLARGNLWVDPSKAENVLGWIAGHDLVRDAKVLYDSWKARGSPSTQF